jgi:hypothetical protein
MCDLNVNDIVSFTTMEGRFYKIKTIVSDRIKENSQIDGIEVIKFDKVWRLIFENSCSGFCKDFILIERGSI